MHISHEPRKIQLKEYRNILSVILRDTYYFYFKNNNVSYGYCNIIDPDLSIPTKSDFSCPIRVDLIRSFVGSGPASIPRRCQIIHGKPGVMQDAIPGNRKPVADDTNTLHGSTCGICLRGAVQPPREPTPKALG